MAKPELRPHVLAIPVPAQGHLNPLMRLCQSLANQGFLVSFLNVDVVHQRMQSAAHKPAGLTPQGIRLLHVPLPGVDLANDFRVSLQDFAGATDRLSDSVQQLLHRLAHEGTPVTCLISDILLSAPSQKIADAFGIPRIAFIASSASRCLFVFYLMNGQISTKDAVIASRKRNNPSDLFHSALPGIPALRNVDLPYYKHILDESEFMYHFFNRQCKIAFDLAHEILVNSFEDLEGPAFDVLRKRLNKPIYGVGPLLEDLQDGSNTSLWKEEDDCLDWLESQAPQSVLYVSFGSVTVLSKAQFEEVCAGLEASNQRFLWAFRPDLVEGSTDVCLPQDFVAKTKGRGYVVKWAPQLRVLSHESVGGFLTHCGWNSTVESVAKGVPMLCWPYFADQFINAKYVVEEWKVGMRCEQGEGGLVGRSEVERVVREFMEGEAGKEVKKNVAKLREAAVASYDEKGSSQKNMKALHLFLSNTHTCESPNFQ